MKRKIYADLLKWKAKSGKTSLLIEGARRVGKSYIVTEFARHEYESFVIIDFSRHDRKIEELFENYLNDLDSFSFYLQTYLGVKLVPRKSLIVFDEVQFFPPARAATKHLVADGRFDYISTGSLVSIRKNVKDILIPSEEEHLKMFPMDFEEFLWATDNEQMMTVIRKCFAAKQALGPLHEKAMHLFRLYLIVGGMPMAVQAYVETTDFTKVDAVKRVIMDLYRDDMAKHAKGAELKARSVFDEIPGQ